MNTKKIQTENLPVVTLVGRVNVGKSTLFNRLTEEQKAIVSSIPGTTRTSNEGLILWRGKYVKLIDTGGLTFTDDIPLEDDILKQTERAMKEADVIIFVTNAKDGILPQEKELAKRIRRIEVKPVLFVANKVDSAKDEFGLNEPDWHKLGLGEPIPLSAANGRRVGDFLDILFTTLNKTKRRPKSKITEPEKIINVSIIGKPNAGKSSLFNKLIGEEKVIVSPLAHTTREPHDTLMIYEDQTKKYYFNFVDTAGIRRKAKVAGSLERQGIQKSLKMIEKSEMILFVLDGNEIISTQDKQLAGMLERHSKSVIIILNKWDLSEDNSDQQRNAVKKFVYESFPHLNFAPIILVSSLTGYRVHDVFPFLTKTWQARQNIIPEETLHNFIKQTIKEHLPSRGKGVRHPEVLGLRQINSNPPVFEMRIKVKTSLNRSYVQFVERRLREQFDFFGTPIIIKLTKAKR